MFYLLLALVLFLQSSVLVGIFGSYLFVPDILLSLLFLSSVRGPTNYARGFIGGFLLDVLLDTLGWHASGKLLALFVLSFIKRKFFIETLPSLMVAYLIVALLEHSYRLLLFRYKFYYPLEPVPLLIGFLVELVVVANSCHFLVKSVKS
jgi:rod shape-determining protein MreD